MSATADAASVGSTSVGDAGVSRLGIVKGVVGCWQAVLAVATVLATLVWWPLAEQKATLHVWEFDLNPAVGILLVGLAGSVAGSLVHTMTIFGSRTGRNTFEASYLWWYLLRPFAAALLGLIFVSTVHSGILVVGGASGGSAVIVAYIAGGLAGLFTDAVLQKLRSVLGATSTEEKASVQDVPFAAAPAMSTRDQRPANG